MGFSDDITRIPRPYQPEIGAEAAALFAQQPAPFRELVRGAAGSAPYLAGLLHKERDWIGQLVDGPPEQMLDREISAVITAAAPDQNSVFRQAKRRIALLTALADLGGVWGLGQVTAALTRLADTCVDAGLKALVAAEIARGKLPGLTERDTGTAGGLVVLAMGKMGAGELNYSSDIDLICLFDETRFAPEDYGEARAGFIRVTRKLAALLSDVTAEGYVFRTDLRLRPDPSVTPVCIAMEAAERYYESVGRTWERAAFVKARACGGDIAAGQAFLDRLTPFVWRKHLDFAAIEDAHDMRLRIRDHKGLGGALVLEGHDLKLGRGGIREIEFFTQTRQIIAGGRDKSLRVRETQVGLSRLAAAGWVPEHDAEELSANYRMFREVEHRLQMLGDAQTHALPGSAAGFDRLADLMAREVDDLRDELTERLTRTNALTDAFFAPDLPKQTDQGTDAYLERWRSLPALRSPRATEIFRRLFPDIKAGLDAAPRPEEAMQAFERFVSGLPAGVQVFSLFEANPQLTALIVDICTASEGLAGYLSRNAQVFDAVLGGGFFSPWPGREILSTELAAKLQEPADYEGRLDLARRLQKEWHFRIGVHQLKGLITMEEAGAQYADLAEAVLRALFPVVTEQFAAKHGQAPGPGAAILAMGSLGAGMLTAASDLDLIIIYDADGAEGSDGPRPLTTRAYFARLTQALVTALSAPTAEGKLYEVDMRLRPSGQSGPVATSFEAFASYQSEEAWQWEHMALTRARPIAGAAGLMDRIRAVRETVLGRKRAAHEVARETQEMRDRLLEAGRTGSLWHVKEGPGGVQDIELLAQSLVLIIGAPVAATAQQLLEAGTAGLISKARAGRLAECHQTFLRVQQVLRLLGADRKDPSGIGHGGTEMLLRDLEVTTIDALGDHLEKCRKTAKSDIEQTLAALLTDGKTASSTEAD